jgi:archaellum component FlaC
LKSRVNELIAFKEESRKRINEKLDENNENNLNGRMSYNTLVQELEQIEKEYKTIVSELRKHSMELEHQTIQINKHEEEINWLIDV